MLLKGSSRQENFYDSIPCKENPIALLTAGQDPGAKPETQPVAEQTIQ